MGSGLKFCFIVVKRSGSAVVVLTLRFAGEDPKDIQDRLDAAFKKLTFEPYYAYVSFNVTDQRFEIFDTLEIDQVEDSPGAKEVTFHLSATCKRDFYLPRDLETGEFIDFENQVQCLSVLVAPWEKKEKRWTDWLSAKKKELGTDDA